MHYKDIYSISSLSMTSQGHKNIDIVMLKGSDKIIGN